MVTELPYSCQLIGKIYTMKQEINWLTTLRKKGNLTQDGLATRLQLAGLKHGREAVSAWETGRAVPPLDNVEFRQALANILNMDIKTLLKLAGYEVESKPHSDAAERAAWLIDQLPPDKQDLAVRLVEELAKT